MFLKKNKFPRGNYQPIVPRQKHSIVVSYYCFIIVAAVTILALGGLFLLFVLLYSQRVASHSCETLMRAAT